MKRRTDLRRKGVRAEGVGAWPGTGMRSARADGGRRVWGAGGLGLLPNPALLPIPSPCPAPVPAPDPFRARGTTGACSGGGSAGAAGAAGGARKTRRMKMKRRLRSGMNGVLPSRLCPKPELGPGHVRRRTRSCGRPRCCRCCDCGANAVVAAVRLGSGGACHGSSGPLIGTQREGHWSIPVWDRPHWESQTVPCYQSPNAYSLNQRTQSHWPAAPRECGFFLSAHFATRAFLLQSGRKRNRTEIRNIFL